MDKNRDHKQNRLGGVSEILDWALDNNEQVVVIDQGPRMVSSKKGTFSPQINFFNLSSAFGDGPVFKEQLRG